MQQDSSFKPFKITVQAHRGSESPQGRSNFTDDIGTGNKHSVERPMANGATRYLTFPTNATSTRVITELDRTDPNPWFGFKAKSVIQLNEQIAEAPFRIRRNLSAADLKDILNEDRLTRKRVLELRFDLEPSVLESALEYRGSGMRIYIDDQDPRKQNSQVRRSDLENFKLSISKRFHTATDETLQGALECELLLVSPMVARTYAEFNAAKHSFYILNLEEAARIQAQTQDKLIESIARLHDFIREAGEFEIHAMAIVCEFIRQKMTPKTTIAELQKRLITPGGDQEANAARFVENAKLFDTGLGRRQLMLANYLTRSAENSRVFVVKQGRWLWSSQKMQTSRFQLGGTYESAVATVQLWLDESADDQEALALLAGELKNVGTEIPPELLV